MDGISVTRRPSKFRSCPFRCSITQYAIDAAHRRSSGIGADTLGDMEYMINLK